MRFSRRFFGDINTTTLLAVATFGASGLEERRENSAKSDFGKVAYVIINHLLAVACHFPLHKESSLVRAVNHT